jgi:myo-inositol 2-dehydrogenase/D-chiro-inositol 1-dehydrogenase
MGPLGVGLIGAGAANQAIHMPSIAALGDRLRVVHVMDPDARVGQEVARRAGARYSSEAGALIEDDAVDVVAICSPDWAHADQVEAACHAAKRAILCEKPLAKTLEDACRIAEASRASNVPVVVGAMHRYDPALVAAWRAWSGSSSTNVVVRSTIWLPDNNEMTMLATQQFGQTVTPGTAPTDLSVPSERAAALRNGILGLAIHNLPLVRLFAPEVKIVTEARWVEPYGYAVTAESSSQVARMTALMPGRWAPSWTFEVTDAERHLSIRFPPSYVLSGSATATLTDPHGSRTWQFRESGYENQWRHIADLAEGVVTPEVDSGEAVADLAFAIDIADGAAQHLLRSA